MQPNTDYFIVITKSTVKDEDELEDFDVGNRQRSSYSLHLVFEEKSVVRAINVHPVLPKSIEEVARQTHSIAGLK